jgi:hypothetical protein
MNAINTTFAIIVADLAEGQIATEYSEGWGSRLAKAGVSSTTVSRYPSGVVEEKRRFYVIREEGKRSCEIVTGLSDDFVGEGWKSHSYIGLSPDAKMV